MLQYLRELLIATAHAQTTTEGWTTYMISSFNDNFWNAFGAFAGFAILIGVAIMIFRRVRGIGRRPK